MQTTAPTSRDRIAQQIQCADVWHEICGAGWVDLAARALPSGPAHRGLRRHGRRSARRSAREKGATHVELAQKPASICERACRLDRDFCCRRSGKLVLRPRFGWWARLNGPRRSGGNVQPWNAPWPVAYPTACTDEHASERRTWPEFPRAPSPSHAAPLDGDNQSATNNDDSRHDNTGIIHQCFELERQFISCRSERAIVFAFNQRHVSANTAGRHERLHRRDTRY